MIARYGRMIFHRGMAIGAGLMVSAALLSLGFGVPKDCVLSLGLTGAGFYYAALVWLLQTGEHWEPR